MKKQLLLSRTFSRTSNQQIRHTFSKTSKRLGPIKNIFKEQDITALRNNLVQMTSSDHTYAWPDIIENT